MEHVKKELSKSNDLAKNLLSIKYPECNVIQVREDEKLVAETEAIKQDIKKNYGGFIESFIYAFTGIPSGIYEDVQDFYLYKSHTWIYTIKWQDNYLDIPVTRYPDGGVKLSEPLR